MALGNGIEITWLGHATFRIKSPNGKVLLTDPFLEGNPSTPEDQKTVGNVDIILPATAMATISPIPRRSPKPRGQQWSAYLSCPSIWEGGASTKSSE